MLDQYSRAAPRWQLDFGITFCVPHRRLRLQCSANVGGSSLCKSGYVTLLCRLSAQLGHGDRCRDARESAEGWRWVMPAAVGEAAARPAVEDRYERTAKNGTWIRRRLSERTLLKRCRVGLTCRDFRPGQSLRCSRQQSTARTRSLSFYRSETYRCPSALYAPGGPGVELLQMRAAATSFRVLTATFCQMTGCVSRGTAIK